MPKELLKPVVVVPQAHRDLVQRTISKLINAAYAAGELEEREPENTDGHTAANIAICEAEEELLQLLAMYVPADRVKEKFQ